MRLDFTPSQVFLYALLSFILGIFIGGYQLAGYFLQGITAILFIILFACSRRNKRLKIISLIGVFWVSGIFWYQYRTRLKLAEEQEWKNYLTDPVLWQGIICSEVQVKKEKQSFVFCPSSKKGKVLINVSLYPEYKYGDEMKIHTGLAQPHNFSGFDYKKYLSRQGIYALAYNPEIQIIRRKQGSLVYGSILKIKHLFRETINKIFPEPSASFLNALLLGIRTNLPEDIKQALQKTGTMHIIAISGYNITIIARLLSFVLVGYFLKRQQAFYVIFLGIIFFVVLTGAEASVVRAGIMGALVLCATQAGRLSQITNALVFSAFLMLIYNPSSLRFDAGFQLSFSATLGLVYLGPVLEKKLKFVPRILEIRQILSSTLSAQIFVLPLLIDYFHNLSLIAPLANLLVLPIIPWLMVFGFIAVLVGIFFLPLGWILGFSAWILFSYEMKIILLLAKIPFSSLEIRINTWMVVAYYIILAGLLAWGRRKTNLMV